MFASVFSLGSSISSALDTPEACLEAALNPYGQADDSGSWNDDNALVVQTVIWNTAESKLETVPYHCPHTGRVIAAWARLDNRRDLMDSLAMTAAERSDATDPMIVLAAFDRWGERCVDHLLGDFSFVIYDPAARTVFAARDPLGVRPLYYHESSDLLIVATTPVVFRVVEGLALTPAEEWMVLYIVGLSKSHTETAWLQVKKLPGGHHFSVDGNEASVASSEPKRYHEFRDDPPATFTRDEGWVERYRTILEDSVRCRLRSDYPVGSETSGGLDSSTCVGLAAKLWQRSKDELHTFGLVRAEKDEKLITETSRMHGLKNNHIHPPGELVDPDALRDRSLLVLGYPGEHSSAITHDRLCEECAVDDVRTLLSGFGGDEVTTNPGNLLVRELVDNHRFARLYAEMHGPQLLRPLRFVRALARHRRAISGSKRPSAELEEQLSRFVLRQDVVDRYGLRERYEAALPFDDRYRSINTLVLEDHLAGAALPTRLETCTLLAQARGVEYRWPLLDVRLIQQYLSTPSIEKRKGAMGRYLHRRAITGVVPPKVQWQRTKHMGDPLMPRRRFSRVEPVAKLCADLHPALRSIVDSGKLQRDAARVESNPSSLDMAATRALDRQFRNLWRLNTWLHRCHP